jgi:hypothetical protein
MEKKIGRHDTESSGIKKNRTNRAKGFLAEKK